MEGMIVRSWVFMSFRPLIILLVEAFVIRGGLDEEEERRMAGLTMMKMPFFNVVAVANYSTAKKGK